MLDRHQNRLISRRSLLRRGSCAALGLGGLSAAVHPQSLTQADPARVRGFREHRALVCVFLCGGNDNGNTVIPLAGAANGQNHGFYARQRTTVALPRHRLHATRITPAHAGGRSFALHPKLSGLARLFASGDLSVVANVGRLVEPVTRAKVLQGARALPPQLFAHHPQRKLWQTATADADADAPTGWAGRLADALRAGGANPDATVSMNLSIAGDNFFQMGRRVPPCTIGPVAADGPDPSGVAHAVAEAYADRMALQHHENFSGRHHLRRAFTDRANRTPTDHAALESLFALPSVLTPLTGGAPHLTRQLRTVARLIEHGRSALRQTRQIFFVAIGGFDHHAGLVAGAGAEIDSPHGRRLAELNDGLVHFWTDLGRLGLRDQVTTFTASEFGRSFAGCGTGSDHGWGGHHFVMGGRQLARGPAGGPTRHRGQMFGTFNDLTLDGPDDIGRGRFIPTTSVDEYAAEFARWMGVPAGEMSTVFPNLARFRSVRAPLNMLS